MEMTVVKVVLWCAGLYPLVVAWRQNRVTSLRHAVGWAIVAWLGWAWALLPARADSSGLDPARFVALCLTGAAGVAVLGARRPYVLAWNFVVIGLLSVILLPLIESVFIGTDPVDPLRICFLSATLAVGLLNYLPTGAGPAVLLIGGAAAGEFLSLFGFDVVPPQFCDLLVLLAPWAVWGCWRGRRPIRAEFDALWLDFRDRLGLFWSQRVREQFNQAAAHAGWPVRLAWRGLHRTDPRAALAPEDQAAILATMRKALQRFRAV
jgi:hypothetical protein